MARLAAAGWAGLLLAACSASQPNAEDEPAPASTSGAAEERSSLYGRWRIVEVNGAPPRSVQPGSGYQPTLGFSPEGYGGSTGCNSFGGVGLLVGARWFGDSPMQTEMGCGDLTAQEEAVIGVVAGGPMVSFQGADAATLTTPTGVLRLAREREAAAATPPTAASPPPPMLLAGTRWTIYRADGDGRLPSGTPPRLTLEADRWTLETACGARTGAWRQDGEGVVIEPGARPSRACAAGAAAAEAKLAEAVARPLRYVVGPNGELVLAGGDHWISGQRDISLGRGETLTGQWRVVSVDGTPPPPSGRPAEVNIGPGAYAVWDGCRHSEGVAIVYARRLFTRGSGVVTDANCPADPVRARINGVVAESPRIAMTGDGGIALVSRGGALRLARQSPRAFGTGVVQRLSPGMAFDLPAGRQGTARLTLNSGRFTVVMACGQVQGQWRTDRSPAGSYARFSPDPLPATCAEDAGARRLEQFFTGDVLAAIGPNRDIALFVNREDSLAAQVAR
jgi:heat shock protein HslJ